jgi:hypothetical protein
MKFAILSMNLFLRKANIKESLSINFSCFTKMLEICTLLLINKDMSYLAHFEHNTHQYLLDYLAESKIFSSKN